MTKKTKLDLSNVTVCAADCLHPELAAGALEKCLSGIDFADAILFSDREARGGFRWQPIAPLKSIDDYSRFCLREMGGHISTPFALVVQWDGYIVDPGSWNRSFLQYDYIGAPWKSGIVGNGGFSLRSKKLLDALKSIPVLPGFLEDWIICGLQRTRLEQQHGIRFAPKSVAARFSYEELPPAEKCFGFHGFFNMYRHESDADLIRIAAALGQRGRASWQYFGLILNSLRHERTDLAVELYALSRNDMSVERLTALASKGPIPPRTVAAGVEDLEARLATKREATAD